MVKKKIIGQIIEEENFSLAKKDRIQCLTNTKKEKKLKRQLMINLFIQERVDRVSKLLNSVESYFNQNKDRFKYEARQSCFCCIEEANSVKAVKKQMILKDC